MKTIPFIVLSFLNIVNSFAQTILFKSNIGDIMENSRIIKSGTNVKIKDPENFILVYKQGYVTQGIEMQEIVKKQLSEYTFNLNEFKCPSINKDSKKIKIVAPVDKTRKLAGGTYIMNGQTYTYPGANLDDTKYTDAFGIVMQECGFNVIGINSSAVFKEREKNPDLAIGCEIIRYSHATMGTPGFKVSILANWSVYDVAKEEIIYKMTSGGYSNTGNTKESYGELLLALKDALKGLITDPEFIKLCNDKSYGLSADKVLSETLKLPKIEVQKFNSSEKMIESSIKSVVTLKTEYGHGSGFIINTDGYILTNSHVVYGSDKIEAIFSNGLVLPVTLIAENKKNDVALVRVIGGGYNPLPSNSTDDILQAGSEVIAIGTPENLKLGQTVTKGIVSGNRVIDELNYIQTDVSINSGNSGGPLINSKGEAIGIIAAKVKGTGIEGLGFAIPIKTALKALNIVME